jgi:hypothetical protein
MLFGINDLTEETNPKRTQTKPLSPLFCGYPLKTNPNEATKSFRLGVPFENEPNLGSTGSTEGCRTLHPRIAFGIRL